ncbi:MAG TPA: hypothetical protein VGO53_03990 [Steroidobacteraceae bacterium]|nr:hypothetical protein [Steroidobacteraceae bacterium]
MALTELLSADAHHSSRLMSTNIQSLEESSMNTRDNTSSLRMTFERVIAGVVFGSAALLAVSGPFLMGFIHTI